MDDGRHRQRLDVHRDAVRLVGAGAVDVGIVQLVALERQQLVRRAHVRPPPRRAPEDIVVVFEEATQQDVGYASRHVPVVGGNVAQRHVRVAGVAQNVLKEALDLNQVARQACPGLDLPAERVVAVVVGLRRDVHDGKLVEVDGDVVRALGALLEHHRRRRRRLVFELVEPLRHLSQGLAPVLDHLNREVDAGLGHLVNVLALDRALGKLECVLRARVRENAAHRRPLGAAVLVVDPHSALV